MAPPFTEKHGYQRTQDLYYRAKYLRSIIIADVLKRLDRFVPDYNINKQHPSENIIDGQKPQ